MRADIYHTMASVEDDHWWFRARRCILTHLLAKLALPPGAAILDAGSGTGGNLAMLAPLGNVYAMEMDADARALADARGIVKVQAGSMPDNIPFGGQLFDLIVMFDVLEHIEQDYSTLKALHARLAPQGKLLLTVPAFEFLWSLHDVAHHHKRRYGLAPLIRLIERTGYKVRFASYINFWLFPVIAVLRVLDRITHGRLLGRHSQGNAELATPPAKLNRLLEGIFASEANLLDVMRLPFGVSIVLLAEKV